MILVTFVLSQYRKVDDIDKLDLVSKTVTQVNDTEWEGVGKRNANKVDWCCVVCVYTPIGYKVGNVKGGGGQQRINRRRGRLGMRNCM